MKKINRLNFIEQDVKNPYLKNINSSLMTIFQFIRNMPSFFNVV